MGKTPRRDVPAARRGAGPRRGEGIHSCERRRNLTTREEGAGPMDGAKRGERVVWSKRKEV